MTHFNTKLGQRLDDEILKMEEYRYGTRYERKSILMNYPEQHRLFDKKR